MQLTIYPFKDAPPVIIMDDKQPIPLPASQKFEPTYYYFNNLVRRPIVRSLEMKRIPGSGDVNSMDHVPGSSRYTPRLGYRDISPAELLHGCEQTGPPEPPFSVIKAKSGGTNPGFIVRDARGIVYLVKFDPPEFPAIQTITALIVNRLFWGFGYNVPEDYLALFRQEDLQFNPDAGINREDVEYTVDFHDGSGTRVRDGFTVEADKSEIRVPMYVASFSEVNYLRVDVCAYRGDYKAGRTAQFHFRNSENRGFKLVGVVH